MAALFASLLFFARVLAEEVATPSSLLGARNFNLHAFTAQYRPLNSPETTKHGPVLFPNDAPPPPRPPLIVTSRPLSESIARSELNPLPQNNSIPQSSQLNHVVKPYLARIKDYRPFAYVATPAPSYGYLGYPKRGRERYEEYEERPVLPPIYKVLADHAKQKAAKIKQHRNKNNYDYQIKGPEYYHHRSNKGNRNGDDDDDEGKNYAFSYRVNDKETGDDFSHTQQSSGSATNGEYRVRLPDGRMQIVSYTADENGYQADVRYADDEKTSNDIDNRKNDYDYGHNFDDHNSIDNKNEYYNDVNTKPNHYENYQPQYDDKFEYKNDNIQTKAYKIDEDVDDKYKSNNDYYNDNSKEYYNDDFSKEYESKSYDYAPHVSKFSNLVNNNEGLGRIIVPTVNYASQSTVRPSYEELKDLLVTKAAYNTVQPDYNAKIPVTISVPSTTPSTFEGTTERVVLIGGKKSSFYTDIRNIPLVSPNPLLGTPSPETYVSSDFSPSPTPQNYLVSTINSLKKQVDLSGPKPILSNSFINKINKYLSFN